MAARSNPVVGRYSIKIMEAKSLSLSLEWAPDIGIDLETIDLLGVQSLFMF